MNKRENVWFLKNFFITQKSSNLKVYFSNGLHIVNILYIELSSYSTIDIVLYHRNSFFVLLYTQLDGKHIYTFIVFFKTEN